MMQVHNGKISSSVGWKRITCLIWVSVCSENNLSSILKESSLLVATSVRFNFQGVEPSSTFVYVGWIYNVNFIRVGRVLLRCSLVLLIFLRSCEDDGGVGHQADENYLWFTITPVRQWRKSEWPSYSSLPLDAVGLIKMELMESRSFLLHFEAYSSRSQVLGSRNTGFEIM